MIPINIPLIGEEEIRAAVRVLRSGLLTDKGGRGPNVTHFERAFAKFIGTKYAVAVNNGTSAIHSALLAAQVGKGDEVILPSFTFVATAEMVALTGARPVFVDVDRFTYCMDPERVEDAITNKTKAIISVHLYGLTGNIKTISELAQDNNITLIEDAAQAHGAKHAGRMAGDLGNLGCFSFYGSKNMTTGEGGMVTTNNRDYAETIRSIRNHGEEEPYESVHLGHNYRMPELEAAIGLEQLSKMPRFLKLRRKNAFFLKEQLEDIKEIQLPLEPKENRHGWYVFTIRIKRANAAKRNKILTRIRRRRVDAKVYYPKPIHKMPYYSKTFGSTRLGRTETLARQVFSLPVHPGLNEAMLLRIIKAVKLSIK